MEPAVQAMAASLGTQPRYRPPHVLTSWASEEVTTRDRHLHKVN